MTGIRSRRWNENRPRDWNENRPRHWSEHRLRERSQDRLRADLATILTPEPRKHLPLLIWRWRYELALMAGIVAALTVLVTALGIEWGMITASVTAGVCSPPWPRAFTARVWCVITAHRLRSGLVQARIQTRRGRLPVILSTTPTPYGERVRLWCPAGITAEALKSARNTLRAACWAADVRVTRDNERSQRVTVDVIRRQPEPRPETGPDQSYARKRDQTRATPGNVTRPELRPET